MFRDERLQGSRHENGPEPVESLATIIPRLLALRGLAPVADVATTDHSDERPRIVEATRIVVGGRAV